MGINYAIIDIILPLYFSNIYLIKSMLVKHISEAFRFKQQIINVRQIIIKRNITCTTCI